MLLIIVTIIGLMGVLAAIDLHSFYRTEQYKDLRGSITGLGLLGTFIGITVALTGFDQNDLTRSVPELLGGMKLAFWTSAAGMCMSLSLSIIYKMWPYGKMEDGMVNELLRTAAGDLKELAEHSSKPNPLVASFNPLANRIERLVNQLVDHKKELDKTVKEQLTVATEQIAQDFANSIKENFGENFSRLDRAAKAVLRWQETNLQSLEAWQAQMSTSAESIRKAGESLNTLVALHRDTTGLLNHGRELITDVRRRMKESEIQIDSYRGAINRLNDALVKLEQVEERFADFTRSLSTTVEFHKTIGPEQIDQIHDAAATLQVLCERLTQASQTLETIPETARSAAERTSLTFSTIQNQVDAKKREINRDLSSAQQKSNQDLRQNAELTKKMLQQSETIRQDMSNLQRSIESASKPWYQRLFG